MTDFKKDISEFIINYCEGFFEDITDYNTARNFSKGQIVRTIPTYPIQNGKIYALRSIEGEENDDFHLHRFRLSQYNDYNSLSKDCMGTRIHDIGLKSDECLLVMKTKTRIAIFIREIKIVYKNSIGEYAIVIPIFNLKNEDDSTIKKISCFENPEKFFIPICTNYSKICSAHFDKIQAIPIRFVKAETTVLDNKPGFKLNEYAMIFFDDHFNSFLDPIKYPFSGYRVEIKNEIEKSLSIRSN